MKKKKINSLPVRFSLYEENHVTRILKYLIRHPHLDFIDVGANIGTYTMYIAALGRFVLAIDCFESNLIRLRRAVQLTNNSNRVVLVQMEWKLVRQYDDRAQVIINFFNKRDYYPMTELCTRLDLAGYKSWPNEIFWKKANSSTFC